MVEWRYGPSGQLPAPAASPSGKETPISIGYGGCRTLYNEDNSVQIPLLLEASEHLYLYYVDMRIYVVITQIRHHVTYSEHSELNLCI